MSNKILKDIMALKDEQSVQIQTNAQHEKTIGKYVNHIQYIIQTITIQNVHDIYKITVQDQFHLKQRQTIQIIVSNKMLYTMQAKCGLGHLSGHVRSDIQIPYHFIQLYVIHLNIRWQNSQCNKPELVQIMAACRTGDKLVSEPVMVFTDEYMSLI